MNNELYHYGIRGMRWGVRKDRERAGSAGNLSNKQMRKELRADRANAFRIGAAATVYGRAMVKGSKKLIKIENKIDKISKKKGSAASKKTQKLYKKWNNNAKALAQVSKNYNATHKKAKQHVNELIKKYGKENVKGIKYKEFSNDRIGKYRLMNERVNRGKDYATSALVTIGSASLFAAGITPIAVVAPHATKTGSGNATYRRTVRNIKNGKS